MSAKRFYGGIPPKKNVTYIQKIPTTLSVLDAYHSNDIKKLTDFGEKLLKYELEYYSVFANQRSRIFDQLCASLSSNTYRDFEFQGWQRSITYRWSLQPLSAQGSIIDPGGRFNIGEIDSNRFPIFPALYIASDKETALQEHLGQSPNLETNLNAFELALTNTQSISVISLSGKLESIIDLTTKKSLRQFCHLIKDFEIPSYLLKMAADLKVVDPPAAVTTAGKILETLLAPNWRAHPMQFDIPANSQIFGQIVSSAGIEGILYPSKMTGQNCLAVFPQNFKDSSSFIKLDDAYPAGVSVPILDSSTWEKCI